MIGYTLHHEDFTGQYGRFWSSTLDLQVGIRKMLKIKKH